VYSVLDTLHNKDRRNCISEYSKIKKCISKDYLKFLENENNDIENKTKSRNKMKLLNNLTLTDIRGKIIRYLFWFPPFVHIVKILSMLGLIFDRTRDIWDEKSKQFIDCDLLYSQLIDRRNCISEYI
jgi:hypothetical protein